MYRIQSVGRYLTKNKDQQLINEMGWYLAKDLNGWEPSHRLIVNGPGEKYIFEAHEKIKVPSKVQIKKNKTPTKDKKEQDA